MLIERRTGLQLHVGHKNAAGASRTRKSADLLLCIWWLTGHMLPCRARRVVHRCHGRRQEAGAVRGWRRPRRREHHHDGAAVSGCARDRNAFSTRLCPKLPERTRPLLVNSVICFRPAKFAATEARLQGWCYYRTVVTSTGSTTSLLLTPPFLINCTYNRNAQLT